MPNFRPPRWPSKVSSHFDEPERSVPANESVNPTKEQSVLGIPTSAEYTGEAAKKFLDALEAVAELIPFPGVATVVKVAKNVIRACDETHATLERAEELKSRIKKLVTVLVDELKEKKANEIREELQKDIESLSKDLAYIQQKLNEIASQNALLLVVFRSLNEKKVKKCVDRLDGSLANFSLVYQINNAKFLDTLEKQILSFYTSHQKSLDSINGKVDQLQVTMDTVKSILEKRSDLPTTSRPRLRAAIPANAGIFHGRKPLVANLVRILTSNLDGQKLPRVCLLGPGGMGKTSTGLAVMADPEMRKHFPQKNQIWVACVKATSHSLFLDTLYSSLGTTQNTGDALADIISEINSSAEPLVLFLDNFETPWNVEESRSDTVQILHELDQIAHVTLFITMRSSVPPCDGEQWRSLDIEAVDENAARQIYLDICSAGSDDDKVSVLLQALGHMPLAVMLMANTARMTGLGAGELMEEFKRMGTAMLSQGVDSTHNLDICIRLSVESLPMKNHPEAYGLLATLARLPVGATYNVLMKWWACGAPNLMGTLQVLVETALIQRRGAHYYVLPVIRSYILDPSRFPNNVRAAMIASACNFLKQHNFSPGDPSFKDHAEALSAEEGNLQAILLDATDAEPSLIKAFLVLAKHQLSTRPRLEVIEHVLKLARRMEGHPVLVGDVLTCYGRILCNLDRYDQAVEQLTFARQTFLSIPNEQRASQCLLDIVDVYAEMPDSTFEKDLQLVLDAKSVFERLGNAQGVALSLFYLGFVNGQYGFRTEGIKYLTLAREKFQNLGDALNQAKCSYSLEYVYYWDGRYDDALKSGMAAIQEYEHLGLYSGDAMQILGRIFFMQGNYPDTLETLVRALGICKSYGRPGDIAQSLEMIGRTWAKMDRQADAQGAYAEAMEYYNMIQLASGEEGKKRCQILTRQAENPFLVLTSRERHELQGLYNDF